jgi:hypothetical protein
MRNVAPGTRFQFISDALTVYAWILLHLANTATSIHHDACGFITAAICLFGKKLWIVFLPRKAASSQEAQNENMIKAILLIDDGRISQAKAIIKKHFRPVCFILEPGDIL